MLRQVERLTTDDVEAATVSYASALEQLRVGAQMLVGLADTYDHIGADALSSRDRSELDAALRLIGEAIDRISDPG